MLRVNIMLGLYSVIAVLVDGSSTSKEWKNFKRFRSYAHKKDALRNTPQFEETEDEILAKVGDTAKLPCSVKNLGDNVVSWIRQETLHILTTGMTTFTGDKRFQTDHPNEDSSQWDLNLFNVQTTDAGIYECQINTEPKLKRSVFLVVSPGDEDEANFEFGDRSDNFDYQTAKIVGPAELFVHVGSTVTIICQIKINRIDRNFTKPISKYRKPIRWFHFSKPFNIRSQRGGISIDTTKLSNSLVSYLTIVFVTNADFGVYTCKPIKGQAANVTLHILQNEEMEAVKPENYLQSNNAVKDDPVTWKNLFLLYPTLFIRFRT